MLKFLFWLLLLANGLLFAWHQGYLGDAGAEAREAGRLTHQLRPESIRLLSESSARAAAAPLFAAAPAAEPAAAVSKADAACIEIGEFDAAAGQRFAERLAALGLQAKASTRPAGTGEAASYMVYIAPPAERAGLEPRLAELRQLGVRDYFVLPQSATPPGGISLGVFKSEEAARAQLASLGKKGVRGARIQARGGARHSVELRGLDQAERQALEQLRAEFPERQARPCAPQAAAG